MRKFVIKTISLTSKSIEKLDKMKKKTKINESKLLRMFINYFDRNKSEFKKMLKNDYDVD